MTWIQVFILSLCLATIHVALAATAEQWRSRHIYQLVTDRFAVATNTVAPPCAVASRTYCTGSWKGIQEHLDYIKNLGFDAVWISPVVANVEGTSAYGQAYHGYWTEDITKLNSHFGTPDDLKQLIQAIHSAGMYVMLDVVVNHFAVIPSNGQVDFSHIVPFSSSTNFHRNCSILPSDYGNNQTAVEQCWLGDDKLPLVDLDTENPEVVKTMQNWIKDLVTTYGIDGIRIDTVKHIRKDFWPGFASAAGVYTLGEVFDARVDYVAEYTKVMDGILDYPTYFAVYQAFSSSSPDLSTVVDVVTKSQQSYKNGLFFSGSFMENHDRPRFQSHTKDIALVKNAIAWPFVNDGLPILYYGQEQGFDGGNDPSNREPMWTSGYAKNTPLATHVRYLNIGRQLAGDANSNFYTTAAQFVHQSSPSLLAVWKPPLLALLTNIGSAAKSLPTWNISGSEKLFKSKEKVVDILTCVAFTADDNGGLSIVAEGGLPKVLLPASIIPTTGRGALCSNGSASFAKHTLFSLLPFPILYFIFIILAI